MAAVEAAGAETAAEAASSRSVRESIVRSLTDGSRNQGAHERGRGIAVVITGGGTVEERTRRTGSGPGWIRLTQGGR